MSGRRVLSVSELNEYVRRTLAADPLLRSIQLRGEISNFKRHSAGHLYFSLKDDGARVACVMFRSAAQSLRIQPCDGMRVVLTGSAALYTQTGQYQFYVDAIRDDGVGELHLAFERLKEKLRMEGLFDAGQKKPLPLLPRGVGIVTSATGAVVHDIEQVAARRNPGVQLYLRPTLVQGDGAAGDIVRAIEALDRNDAIDVLIVGRGGGSLEELWPFNEEIVARAIYACKKPVVSAVGHETDFSIADFVADVRAATPSAAAELVVPKRSDLQALLASEKRRLARAQAHRLSVLRHRLTATRARLGAQHPARTLSQQRAHVDALAGRLTARIEAIVAARRILLAARRTLLDSRVRGQLAEKQARIRAAQGRLNALAPERVLARGYAVVLDGGGGPLMDASQAQEGALLDIRLHRGALAATVTEVINGGEKGTED